MSTQNSASSSGRKRRRLLIGLGIAGAVLGLGLTVLILVARSPERRVAKLLTEALIYRRTGQLERETQCLEEALAIKPEDPVLHAKLGRNLQARGSFEKAEEHLGTALAGHPDDVNTGFDYLEVLVERGKLDAAEKVLRKLEEKSNVLADEGYRDRVHAARASLSLRRGDSRRAAEELEATLGPNPTRDAPLRLSLVTIYASQGESAKAETMARSVWDARRPVAQPIPTTDEEKARAEVRWVPDALATRAAIALSRIVLARGSSDEAVAILTDGHVRTPRDPDCTIALAAVLVKQRKTDEALALAKELETEKQHSAAALVRGRVALAKGDRDKARAELEASVAAAPGLAIPALAAAQLALETGDKEGAKKHVLSIDLLHASAEERVDRCRILKECGQLEQAMRELEPILAAAPGHPMAVELLVRLYVAQNDVAGAQAALEKLAARTPDNRVIARARTVLALLGSDPSRAVELSKESIGSLGGDTSSFEVLSAALALDGGVTSAVKELEKVAQEAKDDGARVRAWLQAAELYRALGRSDLSVPILERALADKPGNRDIRLALGRSLLGTERVKDVVAILAPLLDGEGDPAALLVAASASMRTGKHREAIAFAKRAQADPRHGSEATALAGVAAAEASDRAAAREAFAHLRELRPTVPLGYVGALTDLLDQPAEAVKVLKTAYERLGPLPFAVPLAVALDLAQPDDDAVRFAREACEKAPTDTGAAYVLAATLARRGRTAEATEALAKANVPPELKAAFAELDKTDLADFETLLALRRHGLNRSAGTVARKLADRKPKNLVVALHAARAIAATGDLERAVSLLEGCVQLAPKFVPCRLELGYLRRLTPAGAESALRTFEEGAALLPGDPALQLAIGVTTSELGKREAAEKAYRAVLEVDAKNGIARNNLAWLLLEKNTPESLSEGLALAEAVVKDAPQSASALDTLARIELARGDAPKALKHSHKACEMAPLDGTLRLGLAKALDALGRKRDAANQYEIALLLSQRFLGRAEAEQRLTQLREQLAREKKS